MSEPEPTKTIDAKAWISIMNDCLTLDWSSKMEDRLNKPLMGLEDTEIEAALRSLGEAFDSESFHTLGLHSEPKKSADVIKSQKKLMLIISSQLFLTHGKREDIWGRGLTLLDRAVRSGWTYSNHLTGSRRWALMRASVSTDCPEIVRGCARVIGEDLHAYFQQACETGANKVFDSLAPRQAKRHDSLSLQRAIVDYNVVLVERLIPHSVPRKGDSLCLRRAAESIAELEGLGIFGYQTSKMKNMSPEVRAKRLEDAGTILRTIAQHCDAVDALRNDKGNEPGKKKNEERDRIRALILQHAPEDQWRRLAKRKAMREAIPALFSWHERQRLAREAKKERGQDLPAPGKPRAI